MGSKAWEMPIGYLKVSPAFTNTTIEYRGFRLTAGNEYICQAINRSERCLAGLSEVALHQIGLGILGVESEML